MEAQDIMRRAAGDVAGKTVAAQIRQAARHLGYPEGVSRPRELWYGRCASIAALDDLRQRFMAWRAHAVPDSNAMTEHVAAIRRLLVEIELHLSEIEVRL